MRHRPNAVLYGGVVDGIVESLGEFNRLRLMKVGFILPALILFALLIFTSPVGAQDLPAQDLLPDKPVPQGNFFIRPFYDKSVRILAAVDAASATWDDIASRKVIESGGYERNPLMRPFVHNSGTLAVETVGEVWLMAFVADHMKHSHHPILRKTWWL